MIRDYLIQWRDGWNQFWFLPTAVDTLAVMRILVGSMLVYVHAVWTLELETFFGTFGSIIPPEYRTLFPQGGVFAWSHFDWVDSPVWIWGSHALAMTVFIMFTIGFWTRITSVLAFLFVVSYANRATGALFGLDQINAFLTLYLAISNCGRKYSIDRWLAGEAGQGRGVVSVNNTVATRLIQIHLCIVYLFAGLGKLQGDSWWNGEAIWGAIASYEYQTMDLTWMANQMGLVNFLTYVAVAWEFSYPFLIWPKLTRPLCLALALMLHLGIGMGMGMMTFGLIMLYANVAFIHPDFSRTLMRFFRFKKTIP